MAAEELRVRGAHPDDHDDVVAMTEDTWPERDGGDYLGDVFPDWVAGDGDDQRTFAAEAGGRVVGVVQAVRLSDHEAWFQGMRVHPDHRGRGVSNALNDACFEWSRSWGAAVARLMVFSWNVAGLGAARSQGFRAGTEFRWLHPDPDPDATVAASVRHDPDAAFACWQDSDARDHLRGLALDRDETWACSELTRADLRAAADEATVLAVTREGRPGEGGTVAASYRVRDYERDGERCAEYGVAAWDDRAALEDLLAAVTRDAADLGADRTRVLVPETARHVSEAAGAGVEVSDEPDFVLAADLTGQ
jgi:GNAT superfamily N-acetyltransferase